MMNANNDHYRPILNQPASEEPNGWKPEAGEPARTSGGDCMVLAIDRKRNKVAIRWYDGELGVVNVEAIQRPITPREQWVDNCVEIFIDHYGNPKGGEQYISIAKRIYDAIASGDLPTPEKTQ